MSGEDSLGLVGTTVAEKYRVESVVGEGGFAVVYRAMHLVWNRPVALKVFKALLSMNMPKEARDAMMKEFIEEGGLLTDLSTQTAAIVQARDVGMYTMQGGEMVPYMVLEWLEGTSLEDVIARERHGNVPPRDLTQCVALLEPAVLALGLAHNKGIAHRDIKPANFFIIGDARSTSAQVKLLDFGIAKVVQDAQKRAGSFQKTSGNITSFTPMYGAPEQFNRSYGATGPWTDVFSLALMLVEMLSNQDALPGDDLVQLGFASGNPAERPTPRNRGAYVTDAVEYVFLQALAVRPEERFQNASDFWYALKRSGAITLATPGSLSASSMPMPPPGMTPVGGTLQIASRSQPLPPYQTHPGQSFTQQPGTQQQPPRAGGLTLPSGNPHVQGDPGTGKSNLGLVVGLVSLVCVAGLGVLGYNYYKEEYGGPKGTGSSVPTTTATAPVSATVPTVTAPKCPATMVLIEGTEFLMGSAPNAKNAEDDEKPAHSVKLNSYCLDITEVTVKQYLACNATGKCLKPMVENDFEDITPVLRKILDPLCTASDPDKLADHPINCVSWEEATRYCSRMIPNGRLPTEAEWEFAARGSDQRTYPWGEEPPSGNHLNACGAECIAWVKKFPAIAGEFRAPMYKDDDGYPVTAPVGKFPAGKTKHGVLDIVGNVSEWVYDWYGGAYPKSSVSDTADNPMGPKDGKKRVTRGGAWNGTDPAWVRPAQRFTFAPTARSHGLGFRCARPLTPRDGGTP